MTPNKSKRPRRPWSLALRLTAWYVCSAFALLVVATGLLYVALVSSLDAEQDANLQGEVITLRDLLHDHPDAAAALHEEVIWEPGPGSRAPMVRLRDAQGHTVIETPGMDQILTPDQFPTPENRPGAVSLCNNVRSTVGGGFRVLSARIAAGEAPSGQRGVVAPAEYEVQLALSLTSREKLMSRYTRRLWIVLGAGLLGCAAAGYGIARGGIRHVTRVAASIAHITPSTLHERIDPEGFPSELVRLSDTLNGMLDRLQEAFSRLTRFSADIAHELRTPLNVLRGEAEVALAKPRTEPQYREVLGSLLEECSRLGRLIDRLLFLARAESPQAQIHREPVDVQVGLAAIREFYEVVARERGVSMEVEDGESIVASLDRVLFQQAVGNLVENALAHTPRGGRVALEARLADGALRVQVADTGSGIPAGHLPYVFDRFRRVDESRARHTGGAGLGLAIVRSIALLHGGTVEISSQIGRGTQVILLLPAATPELLPAARPFVAPVTVAASPA